jgi:hypothetical protein
MSKSMKIFAILGQKLMKKTCPTVAIGEKPFPVKNRRKYHDYICDFTSLFCCFDFCRLHFFLQLLMSFVMI